MKHGAKLETLAVKAHSRGTELPEIFGQIPDYPEYLDFYFWAFSEISFDRMPSDNGIHPLRRDDVRKWIDERGVVNDYQIEALHYHVRQLDNAYVEIIRERLKTSNANSGKDREFQSARSRIRRRNS